MIYNTSGIPDYFNMPAPGGLSWVTFHYFTVDDCIKASLKPDTLQFLPGSKWDYCNTNYMLLTKIVEKVSGLSFRQFAKQRLFIPLGMRHTLINDDNTEVIPNRVTPYSPRTKVYVDAYRKAGIYVNYGEGWLQHPRNSPHFGGSGVVTTANDLVIWSENTFSRRFGGRRFYDFMHLLTKFENGRNNQAFGLYQGNFEGRSYWGWDGGDYGVSAQMISFPKAQVSIIVLSNRGNGNAAEKVLQIAKVLMDNKIL